MADRTTKIKWLLGLIVLTSTGMLAWVFFESRLQDSPPTSPLTEKDAKSAMTLSRIHHTATRDGIVQWKLEAESADLQSENGKMVLKNPRVDFFLKNGGLVKLKAGKGFLNTNNNNIEVQGNVRIVHDRYTLKTETLVYYHRKRHLKTNVPVQISGQAVNLTAAGMIYDLDTNRATFNGDVNGTIYEKPAT